MEILCRQIFHFLWIKDYLSDEIEKNKWISDISRPSCMPLKKKFNSEGLTNPLPKKDYRFYLQNTFLKMLYNLTTWPMHP